MIPILNTIQRTGEIGEIYDYLDIMREKINYAQTVTDKKIQQMEEKIKELESRISTLEE